MRFLSWNVQWCRGMDGHVDPKRIATEARRLADPDVICLQEIARNFPEMEGSAGEDQVLELMRNLAGYEGFFAPAVDIPAKRGRRRFGNLVLTRLPVGRVMRHQLPWPEAPDVQSMPRSAVEVVVDSGIGSLRVMTTHLEYYSAQHRSAQIERLNEIHLQACAPHLHVDEPGSYEYFERAKSAIVCGERSAAVAWASRSKRLDSSCARLPSAPPSAAGGISLTAAPRASRRCSARQTSPMPPCPSLATSR